MNNWPIYGADGVAINASTTNVTVQVGTDQATLGATDVMIDNPGPQDVYVKAAATAAGAVATTGSMRVPAGSLQPFAKGAGNGWIGVITGSGTQAVRVHVGTGQ